MSELYFSKFPIIKYNGVSVRDLTRRVTLSDQTRSVPTLFYPYEVAAGLRSDVIAHAYYDDSTYDWLIYITNGIVDPYYGWYLDTHNFDALITKKYGSQEIALKKIKYYKLGWFDDDIDIDPSVYENNLPQVLKKYYSPNFGSSTKIISYRRRQEEWTVNTNQIRNLIVAMNPENLFQVGDLVSFTSNSIDFGHAEVIGANSTVVTIHNIQGKVIAGDIISADYRTNCSAEVDNVDIIVDNIPDDEYVFWTPISYFEYERDKNEDLKFVTLLDAGYALDTSEQLRLKLKEE